MNTHKFTNVDFNTTYDDTKFTQTTNSMTNFKNAKILFHFLPQKKITIQVPRAQPKSAGFHLQKKKQIYKLQKKKNCKHKKKRQTKKKNHPSSAHPSATPEKPSQSYFSPIFQF